MLTLTATVSNAGTGASPETTLRWYLSTDGTIEATDTPAGDGDVGSLEAGASTMLTNMVTVSETAGIYHYGACVDAVSEESDPANNCSSGVAVVVAVLAPDPELTVTNMRASETSVAPSGMLTLTATVGNTGVRSSPATTLRWYLSTDGTIETTDTPAGDGAVGSLESAASVTLMGTVTAPGTAGTHYYGACVDAVPEESDPANNCSAAVAVVVEGAPSPNPELIVTNMMVSRALAAPSGMLTLTATVVNNGAGASPVTTLRWYLSTDGTIGTTDTAAGTKSVGTLEAEASATLMGTVTASMTAGTYHYGACVDTVAEESDASNNCSSGVRVVVSSPSAGARLEAFDFNLAAGNTDPTGLWSDGVTLWVADEVDDKLFAYQMPDGTPDPSKDLTLAAGNTDPTGLWSDGATLWVADTSDEKLYAYALASGAYLPAKDLTPATGNDLPLGLWSNGTTLWVANDGVGSGNKVFAYGLASKAYVPANDFNTLSEAGNVNPRDLWSDGVTLWVIDTTAGTSQIFAYQMSDKTRDSDKGFSLAAENTSPRGLWSDGNILWGVDHIIDKLFAYDMRPLVNTSTLSTVRAGLEQIAQAPDLLLSVSPESVSTTASATLALTARITNYGVSLAPMSTLRWYRSTDATLDTTDTLLGTATVGSLAAGGDLTISNMLSAPGAAGTSYYGACADAVTGEHYTGDNCFAVEVTVSTHPHLPASDFNTLSDAGNDHPVGLWSDGTTLWVADDFDDKLFAYKTSDKTRDATKDFTLTADNSFPIDIWSDGATLWVADDGGDKIFAYRMSDGAHDSAKDFNTTLRDAGNRNLGGIWSDGTTMWVADSADNKLYAYVLESKARDSAKDIALTGGNADPRGLWSDGTTLWVADIRDDKLYAYVLENGNRDSAKDFTAIVLRAAGNTDPQGIWSDGATMWVADEIDDKLYAYDARAFVTAASTE